MRVDPAEPAEPVPPRLALVATAVAPDELDELYPDVDGVDLEDAVVALPEARTFDLLRSRLRGGELAVPDDCTLELRDCEVEGLDLTGRRIGALTRVVLRRCRLSGADLSASTAEDVVLDDCALDLASWRQARLTRVVVQGGRLDGLDLTGAHLTDVGLTGVALEGVAIDGIRCERVDLTGVDLEAVTGIGDLAGATISAVQAVALSARLARALGLRVRADGDAFPAGDTQQ